jgi:hypothetical protein
VDFRVIPWPTLRAKPSFLRVFVLTRRAPNPPFPFPWISASFRGQMTHLTPKIFGFPPR